MSNSEVPEAYKIGWVPFIHVNIFLDSRPLIPRTETEYWVDKAIKDIKEKGLENPKILDLCAGSGCIGVAVLKEIPSAIVHFAEIDENHHQTIRKNISENGLADRDFKIFGGNLFENISDKYDFILSNPPYINPDLKERIQDSVLEHEPHQALFGGEFGLEIINKILEDSKEHLNPDGVLYIEHEPEQAGTFHNNPRLLMSDPDQYGVIRVSKFGI